VRERGSFRIRGHDSSDGEASGPCLRISKQFQKGNSPKFASMEFCELRMYGVLRS
jgi:hypothetical protein